MKILETPALTPAAAQAGAVNLTKPEETEEIKENKENKSREKNKKRIKEQINK